MTADPTFTDQGALERHAPESLVLPDQTLGTGTPATTGASMVVGWGQDLTVALQACDAIAETALFPASFWPMPLKDNGDPFKTWELPGGIVSVPARGESPEAFQHRKRIAVASGAQAVVWGAALGLEPPAALASIIVIRGRASMYAKAMEALVRARVPGVKWQLVERTAQRCVISTWRPGNDEWQTFEYSWADAVTAKLPKSVNDKGGNEQYDLRPKEMLHARCRALAAEGTAPDVLRGLVARETVDDDERSYQEAYGEALTGRRAQQAPARVVRVTATDITGGRPDAHAGTAEAGGDDGPMTPATAKALGGWFEGNGLGGRSQAMNAERLRIAQALAPRHIATAAELTEGEARSMLDTLQGLDANGRAVLGLPPLTDTAGTA